MAEEQLIEAGRSYRLDPNADNAMVLARLLLRMWKTNTAENFCVRGYLTTEDSAITIVHLDNRNMTFNNLSRRPIFLSTGGVYYTLDHQSITTLAQQHYISPHTIRRQIRQNTPVDGQSGIARVIEVPRFVLNEMCTEKLVCRLHNLLKYYIRNSSDEVGAGLIADTYLQIQDGFNTKHEMMVERKAKNTYYVTMSNFEFLIYYGRCWAVVNINTRQCFVSTFTRDGTISRKINKFLDDNVLPKHDKNSPCLSVKQELLDALFS